MLGKNRRLAVLKVGSCSSQSISELIRTRVFEIYFVLIHVKIYVASTGTRFQRFVYTVPEAENDTYDRAWLTRTCLQARTRAGLSCQWRSHALSLRQAKIGVGRGSSSVQRTCSCQTI